MYFHIFICVCIHSIYNRKNGLRTRQPIGTSRTDTKGVRRTLIRRYHDGRLRSRTMFGDDNYSCPTVPTRRVGGTGLWTRLTSLHIDEKEKGCGTRKWADIVDASQILCFRKQ